MRREILNAIRAWMGSQCSCFSIGVMWSIGLRSFIRRAAVCSTEDKGCSVVVTPILRDVLHWLPVPLRVEFKICLLVYKSLHGAAPGYLRDYCKETHSSASGLRLRSTDKCDLLVRRMKT